MANNGEGEHFEVSGTVHAHTEQPLHKRAEAETFFLTMVGEDFFVIDG
jgi:hypothetical protein